jgi:amidase
MIGVIGVAPESGSISTSLSGRHGGNMDCKLIRTGSALHLPVLVEGALLMIGDLHASMGDGEICGTGIEISGKATVRARIAKGELHWPLLETSDAWHSITSGATLEEAISEASHEMRRLISKAWGWDSTDVYLYLSARGDVGVNQCVVPCENTQVSVRVSVPKEYGMRPLLPD